jgi:hypothetical protein
MCMCMYVASNSSTLTLFPPLSLSSFDFINH